MVGIKTGRFIYLVKYIAYLGVFASLLSAHLISIDLGLLQLSLFRLIILFLAFRLCIKLLKGSTTLSVKINKNSYSIVFMVIWITYAIISLGWVDDYEGWFRAVLFLGTGVISVISFNGIFKNSDDILTAFRTMVFMAIIHNTIGWYEVYTGDYLYLSTERIADYTRNTLPVSMFGNTNDFATFMLISVYAAYICAANSRLLAKIIYSITMVSSAYLLIISNSRANILALVLSFISFVFLSIQKRKSLKNVYVIILVLFLVILLFPEGLSNYILVISEKLQFSFSEQTGSDAIRMNLLKNGLYFLTKTLGLGTGAGNIEYWMVRYGKYSTGNITNIHNWWMEVLTGYGVVIFVLYLAFYLNLLESLLYKYWTSKRQMDIDISLGIICALFGFAVGCISSSSNFYSEWLWIFWAVVITYQGIKVPKRPSCSIKESQG